MNWHRAFLGDPDWKWSFPEAFQPQLDFKTEWWWYGGHVYDGSRKFSYHAVLFRFGFNPLEKRDCVRLLAGEKLVTSQWIAQWAITDHKDMSYHTGETVLPEGFEFPKEPSAMFIGDARSGLGLRFEFGNPVLQGERGVTQKGPAVGDASYHFACPSSKAKGTLRIGDETFNVRGSCWFDREIGSDMFGGKPGGWEWLCMSLNDGRRISKYWNDYPNAGIVHNGPLEINGEQFRIEPLHNQGFASQLTAPYWETPCRIWRDQRMVGMGFLERATGVLV